MTTIGEALREHKLRFYQTQIKIIYNAIEDAKKTGGYIHFTLSHPISPEIVYWINQCNNSHVLYIGMCSKHTYMLSPQSPNCSSYKKYIVETDDISCDGVGDCDSMIDTFNNYYLELSNSVDDINISFNNVSSGVYLMNIKLPLKEYTTDQSDISNLTDIIDKKPEACYIGENYLIKHDSSNVLLIVSGDFQIKMPFCDQIRQQLEHFKTLLGKNVNPDS